MRKKDIRYMNRRDLLKLLLEVQRENEKLREENGTLRAEVEDRRIRTEQLGSIAEVAMQLHGVFEAAQAAADQYVANAQMMYAPQQTDDEEQTGEETDGEE